MEDYISNQSLGNYSNYQEDNNYTSNTSYDNNNGESDIFNYLESKKKENDNAYTLSEKLEIKENDPNYETKYLNPIKKNLSVLL